MNPLKTYLSALDEKVEAEKKRLTQALKTFNSDVLIEDLEAELAELTQITDEKKQALHTATKNLTTLQSSYDNTQQRLREINSSIKNEARELEIWNDSKGQTAESQCSRDGTLVK